MRKILLTLSLSIMLTLTTAPLGLASAAPPDPTTCPNSSSSTGQELQGIGEDQTQNDGAGNCDSSGVSNLFGTIVGIISYIAGALAVIMIISAGIKYITSGGSADKVGNAKNTLIYAIIGIAVAALAQVMVHYVLSNSNALGGS